MTTPSIKIAPSILAADFTRLGEQVQAAEAAGADLFHIDVMDGRFVPNISMGAFIVAAIRRVTELPLDVHLMIVEPEKYIQQFADAGADIISVHSEVSPHLYRTLQQIRDTGCQAGVAINPHTPAQSLSDVLPLLDLINVMTVNPGFGGQHFIEAMTHKIETLRQMSQTISRPIDIEVDGGINATTAKLAARAGATTFVAGTAIFKHAKGISAGIEEIQRAIADC